MSNIARSRKRLVFSIFRHENGDGFSTSSIGILFRAALCPSCVTSFFLVV